MRLPRGVYGRIDGPLVMRQRFVSAIKMDWFVFCSFETLLKRGDAVRLMGAII